MADLTTAVRDYARQHGLSVPDARRRLLAIALFLETHGRDDEALVAAFHHGAAEERARIAEVVGALPDSCRARELDALADAAIEAYQQRMAQGPVLRLVHSAR